ncbi:MAG: hypothetical protein QOJ65_1145, partial [Fimbriimonadaceae bacterium]|nr:hypothetical protein [Fimbriimonadaceae bacterium]
DDYEETAKEADFQSIADFLHTRLASIFPRGADSAAVLRNSNNSPLFLLTFAAANPKGAATAVKIANHLLERI